jgi:hypothetical protein
VTGGQPEVAYDRGEHLQEHSRLVLQPGTVRRTAFVAGEPRFPRCTDIPEKCCRWDRHDLAMGTAAQPHRSRQRRRHGRGRGTVAGGGQLCGHRGDARDGRRGGCPAGER